MNAINRLFLLTIWTCMLLTFACKKDKTSKTGVPEITTVEVTNILATSALSGGNIISNGGQTIVASGVCWSKSNNTPTISDDTTKNSTSIGSFTAMLKNLSPSATYYVRAYSTNRAGTGYGNVITFSTGNAAPIATTVSISGDAKADAQLTGNYVYSDPEGDAESGTSFQWYIANDAMGAGEAAITGATSKTFRIQESQQGKYIRFGLTPKASTGNLIGIEVKSPFIGAIGEGNTVTFTYNGAEVTYGIILSANTGKKWLDRNLGASRVAQGIDDYNAYGDLFQWGRKADGHQTIIRSGGLDADASGKTGITSTTAPYETSNIDLPSTNKFIVIKGSPGDWRVPANDNLWQGINGANNPCPLGWRIPTQNEWISENLTNGNEAFTKLKLSLTGQRGKNNGGITLSTSGFYWTSTAQTSPSGYSIFLALDASTFNVENFTNRGNGNACRCIKN